MSIGLRLGLLLGTVFGLKLYFSPPETHYSKQLNTSPQISELTQDHFAVARGFESSTEKKGPEKDFFRTSEVVATSVGAVCPESREWQIAVFKDKAHWARGPPSA